MERKPKAGAAILGLLLLSAAMSAIEQPPTTAQETTPSVELEKLDITHVAPPPPPDSGSAIPESPAPEPEPVDLSQFVHRLTIGNAAGSCVSIGDGWYVTCLHVLNADRGNVLIDGVDGGTPRAIRWGDNLRDVAVFRCNVVHPGARFGTTLPEHGAAAVVIGLPGIGTDKQTGNGIVADWDMVSLASGEAVIQHGQSGGGVFVDGNLVGILRGYTQAYQGLPDNPRAAKFTPLFQVANFFPQETAEDGQPQAEAAAPAAANGRWVRRCYGSLCRMEWVPE